MHQENAHPTDEALAEQARQGDEAAFVALMHQYRPEIHAFAYHLLGDAEEAKDATQEVFVRALLSLPRFRRGQPFSPWLHGIASNVAKNARRRLRRRGVSLEDAEADSPLVASACDGPEAPLVARERRRRIRSAVAALLAEYAQIVVLHYYARLSCEEIAQRLRASEGAVRVRLFRAREKLRETLADVVQEG